MFLLRILISKNMSLPFFKDKCTITKFLWSLIVQVLEKCTFSTSCSEWHTLYCNVKLEIEFSRITVIGQHEIKMLSKNTICSHITGFIFGITLQNYLSLFLEASHGNHGHIKEITDAFTVSQIEEIIFLTWWRTQSHQWTKDWNRRHNTWLHTTNALLQWTKTFWTYMSCEWEYLISLLLVYCWCRYMVETWYLCQWTLPLLKRSWRRKACLTVHSD